MERETQTMSPQIFNLYLFSYIYAILSQLYIFLLTPTALRDNFLTSSRRSERGGEDGEEEEEPSRSLCIDGTWSADSLATCPPVCLTACRDMGSPGYGDQGSACQRFEFLLRGSVLAARIS